MLDVEIPISKRNALHLVGKMFNYFVPAPPQLYLLLIPSEPLDPPGLPVGGIASRFFP
jgi:hypothetical protein